MCNTKKAEEITSMPDYNEVKNCKSKCVVFGLHNDINKYKKGNNFVGVIFNPERRKERWSYRKNIAFFTAAMDFNKTLIMVSDIRKIYDDEYERMNKNGRKKIIVDELLWMHDNGYTFHKADNIIIASPSKTHNGKFSIINYRKFSYNYRLARLSSIIENLNSTKCVDSFQPIIQLK